MNAIELHSIYTTTGREFPDKTETHFSLGKRLDIAVSLKLPGQKKFINLGEFKIIDGIIRIPIHLVFLSHAKEDAKIVNEVSERLLQDGILTWFDEKDLLPGDTWENKIDKALKSADYIAIFLSKISCQKIGYFQKEIKYALEQNQLRPSNQRHIIPIMIDECEIPDELSKFHWAKIHSDQNWYDKFVTAVKSTK